MNYNVSNLTSSLQKNGIQTDGIDLSTFDTLKTIKNGADANNLNKLELKEIKNQLVTERAKLPSGSEQYQNINKTITQIDARISELNNILDPQVTPEQKAILDSKNQTNITNFYLKSTTKQKTDMLEYLFKKGDYDNMRQILSTTSKEDDFEMIMSALDLDQDDLLSA